MTTITLQPTPAQRAHKDFNKEIFADFVHAQVRPFYCCPPYYSSSASVMRAALAEGQSFVKRTIWPINQWLLRVLGANWIPFFCVCICDLKVVRIFGRPIWRALRRCQCRAVRFPALMGEDACLEATFHDHFRLTFKCWWRFWEHCVALRELFNRKKIPP